MKYQSNLTSIITVSVEMKLTKNGVVCTQKKGTGIFAAGENFATVAKIRYVAKFPKSSEILGVVAKLSLL